MQGRAPELRKGGRPRYHVRPVVVTVVPVDRWSTTEVRVIEWWRSITLDQWEQLVQDYPMRVGSAAEQRALVGLFVWLMRRLMARRGRVLASREG